MRAAVAGGIPRSEIFVTSKIPCCPGSDFDKTIAVMCALYKDPTKCVEHDFAMLGLDYIDLMVVHWPCDDFESSVATYKAMEPYVESGKIKAIGVVRTSGDSTPGLPLPLRRWEIRNAAWLHFRAADFRIPAWRGQSNFNASALSKLLPLVKIKPVINQCISPRGTDAGLSLPARPAKEQRSRPLVAL